MFYGYCHESGRMRMMDLSGLRRQHADSLFESGVSNVVDVPTRWTCHSDRPLVQVIIVVEDTKAAVKEEHDCHCSCCIRCADAIEYAL